MRRKALAVTLASVEVPDVKKSLETLYHHTKFDALQFRRGTMSSEEYADLAWLIEDFNCLELRVNGIEELWFFDKIIRDHDEFSPEGYSVLLSIRTPFKRARPTIKVGLTYNRYSYLRYFPESQQIIPTQAFALATSDTNPRWTRAIELLEK